MTTTLTRNVISIGNAFTIKDELRGAGCRWNANRKTWDLPVSVANRDALAAVHEVLEAAEHPAVTQTATALAEMPALVAAHAAATAAAQDAQDARINAALDGIDEHLFGYQREGAVWAAGRRWALIADEPGLGKTRQGLAAARAHGANRILVICPAVVKTHWAREAALILGLAEDQVHTITGRKDTRIPGTARVVVINYDILAAHTQKLTWWAASTIILDEAHAIKTGSSTRTKAVKQLVADSNPAHCIALTGTPMLNRPYELMTWLQMSGALTHVGGTWEGYVERFCGGQIDRWTGKLDTKGASNTDELGDLLREHVLIRRTKAEVLTDLPAKARRYVELDLDGQLKEYAAAEKAAVKALHARAAEIATARKIEAEEALTAAVREDGSAHLATLARLAGIAKIDASLSWAVEHLTSTDRKLVLMAHHRDVIDGLVAGLTDAGYPPVVITGDTSPTDRTTAIDAFQNDAAVRVFVGQTKAAGVGITLTAASDIAIIEGEWVPGDLLQAEDRIHRIGQTDNVTAWHLTAPACGIDARMREVMHTKANAINAALDGDNVADADTVDRETSATAWLLALAAGTSS